MGKSKQRGVELRLGPRQQALVRDNIGLVAVHLKRHVTNLAVPQRDREYDDLFQEGCLGLMRSAAQWDAASGIPFAAYALPRIHNAISMALQCKFATIYVPPRRTKRGGPTCAGEASEQPYRLRTRTMSDQQWNAVADRSSRALRRECTETVGDRIREKYERAVRRAEAMIMHRSSGRRDRGELMRLIMRERLLVPNEEARRPLRQIARDTSSSYARVAQCAAQLTEVAQQLLERDPEFQELVGVARRHPEGFAAPIDERVERAMAKAAAEECVRRFEAGTESERASLCYAVARHAHADLPHFLRVTITTMPGNLRHELLDGGVERQAPRPIGSRSRSARPRYRRSGNVPQAIAC